MCLTGREGLMKDFSAKHFPCLVSPQHYGSEAEVKQALFSVLEWGNCNNYNFNKLILFNTIHIKRHLISKNSFFLGKYS